MPTIDEVKKAIDRFDRESEPYEWLLGQLFQKYPRNTNADHVFLKTIVLNKVYNAGLRAEYPVAKHIESLSGLDSLIDKGSDEAVNRIAHVKIGGREFCFLCFASKYCNWHKPCAYPIFDKNVRECLRFHKKDGFAKFTLDSLWTYPTFRDVVNRFRSHYGLDPLEFNYKQLDKYMYLDGRTRLAEAAAKSSKPQAIAGPPEGFRQP